MQMHTGIFQAYIDALGHFVHGTVYEYGQFVPLSRGRVKADITVGSGAQSVMNDFDGAYFGIVEHGIVLIAENKIIQSAGFEITGVVQHQSLTWVKEGDPSCLQEQNNANPMSGKITLPYNREKSE